MGQLDEIKTTLDDALDKASQADQVLRVLEYAGEDIGEKRQELDALFEKIGRYQGAIKQVEDEG